MNNTIEQRILIPIAPELIWDYIRNINNNPDWQHDCRSVSFLTSNHEGRGTRWRSKAAGRGEYVIEVTAWYERLGYEYRIVDGSPFTDNRGWIRIQDTPDGAVVQWAFSYEMSGLLGTFRNTLTVKRNTENAIIESLWNLWRILNQNPQAGMPSTKSLMQDAPDVEARSKYKPRHPSVLDQELPQVVNQQPTSEVSFAEPPVSDDDTRPRPAVVIADGPRVDEPDFLSDIPERNDFWTPSAPETQPALPPQPFEVTEEVEQVPDTLATEDVVPTEPFSVKIDETQSAIDPKLDTSQMSVFDLFGLPKPSETQEMQAITTIPDLPKMEPTKASEVLPTEDVVPSVVKLVGEKRTGMRVTLRQSLVKVRRPK